jgi:hypothetical protein
MSPKSKNLAVVLIVSLWRFRERSRAQHTLRAVLMAAVVFSAGAGCGKRPVPESAEKKIPAPEAKAGAAKSGPARTEPVDLAKLLPGKDQGYTPRSAEFAQLAAALSPQYVMPGRNTVRPTERQRREAMAAAQKYPSPELQNFVKQVAAKAEALARLDAGAARKWLYEQASQIDQAIARGDYTRTATEVNTRYDIGPTGEKIPVFSTTSRPVDESGGARARAADLRALAGQGDAALLAEYRKRLQSDSMWDMLLNARGVSNDPEAQYHQLFDTGSMVLEKVAAKTAGPVSAAPLVSLTRLDDSTLRARNVSTMTLTDVYLDMRVDYVESGRGRPFLAATFLFVPVWKPGEDLDYQLVVYGEPLAAKHVLKAKFDVFAAESSSKGTRVALSAPKK